jgi:endonuclease III
LISSSSIVAALREFYGPLTMPPADLFQFFIWQTLADGVLPARRDLAWNALKRIPALTPDAMFRVPAKDLAKAVELTGSHDPARTDALRQTVAIFRSHREQLSNPSGQPVGPIEARRRLRALGHIDADIRRQSLLFSSGFVLLPIDQATTRVIDRLSGRRPVRAQTATGPRELTAARRHARRWLRERLPADLDSYRTAALYFAHHARHTCTAVAPHCGICPLREGCPSAEPAAS